MNELKLEVLFFLAKQGLVEFFFYLFMTILIISRNYSVFVNFILWNISYMHWEHTSYIVINQQLYGCMDFLSIVQMLQKYYV